NSENDENMKLGDVIIMPDTRVERTFSSLKHSLVLCVFVTCVSRFTIAQGTKALRDQTLGSSGTSNNVEKSDQQPQRFSESEMCDLPHFGQCIRGIDNDLAPLDLGIVEAGMAGNVSADEQTTPESRPEDRRDRIFYPGDTERPKPLLRKLFLNI